MTATTTWTPGLPEVRELVVQGAEELARNYDVDGIHLDDYFYPGSDFDDAAAFDRYGGSFSNVGDWRRENVNQLVKALGERLHAIRPELAYGISPSGVWADSRSIPGGSRTTGGYESYYAAYADSRKWVKEGWIDYICPQIYWYIGHKTMDYAAIARWWADTVEGTGVSLYIGMADYQAGKSDPADPVVRYGGHPGAAGAERHAAPSGGGGPLPLPAHRVQRCLERPLPGDLPEGAIPCDGTHTGADRSRAHPCAHA